MKLKSILNHFLTEQNSASDSCDSLWFAWVSGEVPSPCGELMTYISEVNNGGHSQYFSNVENCSDLQKEMGALNTILPPVLRFHARLAYRAYMLAEKHSFAMPLAVVTELWCDTVFFLSAGSLNRIVSRYADDFEE